MYKKASLIILVGIMAVLFWVLAKPWVENPLRFSGEYSVWLKPLVAIILLVAVEGLVLLVIKERQLALLAILISGLPYLIIFGVNWFYLLAFILMLGLQWLAFKNIESESEERTKINIWQIMRRGLPNIITAILIMISFAYFLSPATQAAARSQKLPSGITQIVERVLPVIAGEQLQTLPLAQRQSFIKQATSDVGRQFTNILGPYFKYMPPILAFGLFLVLQGLSFIFVWLSAALAVLIFWALKKVNFIRINLVKKDAEELDF